LSTQKTIKLAAKDHPSGELDAIITGSAQPYKYLFGSIYVSDGRIVEMTGK
jgi:hypothetical protein